MSKLEKEKQDSNLENKENNVELASNNVEEKVEDKGEFLEINRFDKDDPPVSETVESLRAKIKKLSKRSTRLSTISIIVVFLTLGVGFIFLGTNKILSTVMFGLAVVILIVFFIIIKKLAKPDVKGYVKEVSFLLDCYTFTNTEFSYLKYYKDAKIEYSEIADDSLYKDVGEIVSRNVVEGYFADKSIKLSEMAIFKKAKSRKRETNFIGKYLKYSNNLEFSGRIIIIKKNKEEIDKIDAIDDLILKQETDDLLIYCPKNIDYKKIINPKFITSLKTIKLDEYLLKETFVISAGKTSIYSSYSDEVITLPFNKPIDMKAVDKYRKDLLDSLNLIKLL